MQVGMRHEEKFTLAFSLLACLAAMALAIPSTRATCDFGSSSNYSPNPTSTGVSDGSSQSAETSVVCGASLWGPLVFGFVGVDVLLRSVHPPVYQAISLPLSRPSL